MSSYNNITTRIIDSVFDRANLRVEFRVPADSVYLSNMRLVGLGIFSDNATSSYNELLGALGGVKNISVFDGAVLLEQMNNAEVVNAFKAVGFNNDDNLSVNRHLKYNALGFTASGEHKTLASNQFDPKDIQVLQQNPVADNVNSRAWLSLKDHLSFFKSSMIIPTNIFRNFRIVVEYNSAGAMAQATSVNNATLTTGLSATGDPNVLLLADEVNEGDMRDAMAKNYEGVVYRPLEVDTVVVPAVTGTADSVSASVVDQSNSYLVNGFNGKKLKRIALANVATDSSTFTNGTDNINLGGKGSVALYDPELQVRVNGANKLAGSGISASDGGGSCQNRRLSYLVESWGDFNIIQGGNCIGLTNNDRFYPTATQQYIGNLDYTGLRIDEVINELQLTVNRSGIHGNQSTLQQLRLNIIGEVERAVVMRADKSYNVVYTQ